MTLFIVAVLMWAVSVSAAGDKQIVATGGGVAALGFPMKLEYQTGQDTWNMCFWYRFEDKDDPDYCMFTAADKENPTCKPTTLAERITYSGTKDSSCTITIDKLTDEDDVQWGARVDAQMTNTEMNVTVATGVASVDLAITPEPIVAGQSSTIVCTATGGKPSPTMEFKSDATPSFEITNAPLTVNGNVSTITLAVTPGISDHGITLNCTSTQKDGNGDVLDISGAVAEKKTLNVTFPPQGVARTNLEVDENGNITATATVKANPEPTTYKWIMTYLPDATNITKPDKELKEGEGGDEYEITVEPKDDLTHIASVQLFNLQAKNSGTLKLEAENSVGKQTYEFDVKVNGDGGEDGGDGEDKSGGGISGGVVAIIVIVVIVVVVVSSVFGYKKFYRRRNETQPLR